MEVQRIKYTMGYLHKILIKFPQGLIKTFKIKVDDFLYLNKSITINRITNKPAYNHIRAIYYKYLKKYRAVIILKSLIFSVLSIFIFLFGLINKIAIRFLVALIFVFLFIRKTTKLYNLTSYFNSNQKTFIKIPKKISTIKNRWILNIKKFYINNSNVSKKYALKNIENYFNLNAKHELTVAKVWNIPMPTILPDSLQYLLRNNDFGLSIPAVKSFHLNKVLIFGKCDFLFVENVCLHHSKYNCERDYTPEEMHGLVKINTHKKLVYLEPSISESTKVDKAISLIGSASANYVHWLTETAPKLVLVDKIEQYRDYPILVDINLHKNILSLLDVLNKYDRPIIFVDPHKPYLVNELIFLSPVAYTPFEYKKNYLLKELKIDPSHAFYVPEAFERMRDLIMSRYVMKFNKPMKRLYIRRTSELRCIFNAEQLELALLNNGFQIVEPEKLSSSEQVALFGQAKLIVAQAGAALGNIIFLPPKAHVIILSAVAKTSNYYYFSNIAAMFNVKCSYILSPNISPNSLEPHSSFNVDIPLVIDFLNRSIMSQEGSV